MAFVKISPKDVRQRQFKKGFTGFDPEEVGAYMKSVAAELERQIEQNARLSDLIADLEKKLTVLKVKKIFGGKEKSEDLPPEIKKDVDQILAEAKARAEELVGSAKAESEALRAKVKEDSAKEFEKQYGQMLEEARAHQLKTQLLQLQAEENYNNTVAQAKAKAEEIVREATTKREDVAARIRDEYRAEAEKLMADARARAEQIMETARAEARAEEIVNAARQEAENLAVQELEAARKEIERARAEAESIAKKAREEAAGLKGKQQADLAREVEQKTKELFAKAQAQAEQIVKDAEAKAKEIEPKTKDLLSRAQAQAEQIVKEAESEEIGQEDPLQGKARPSRSKERVGGGFEGPAGRRTQSRRQEVICRPRRGGVDPQEGS
jgi:DivIVA domain-containing protein